MSSRRNTIINLAIILITCVVIIICITTVFSRNNNNLQPEPETASGSETVSLSVSVNEELPSETSTELIAIPEPSTPEDITFSSDEEIYNYAVSQLNQKKYYSAIKYLRKIPGYKDADALQTKTFKLINTDYFALSADVKKVIACEGMNAEALASDKIVSRVDSSVSNGKIAQRGAYWYLDTDGLFHTVGIPTDSPAYRIIFEPILNYNKTVKFEMISFSDDPSMNSTFSNGVILGIDQSVSYFYIDPDNKWGALELFGKYKQDWLGDGEKVIYVSGGDAALTNKGNLVSCPMYIYTDDLYISWPDINASNLLGISYCHGEYFLLSDTGTVAYGYHEGFVYQNDYYPALKDWKDIISIQSGLDYCCGLTSDGKVLLALKGVANSLTPFETSEKVVAITNSDRMIAALTEKGGYRTKCVDG